MKNEDFDPQKTCEHCVHSLGNGKCEMYGKHTVISYNHRLQRCQHFEQIAPTQMTLPMEPTNAPEA